MSAEWWGNIGRVMAKGGGSSQRSLPLYYSHLFIKNSLVIFQNFGGVEVHNFLH